MKSVIELNLLIFDMKIPFIYRNQFMKGISLFCQLTSKQMEI